MCYNSTNVSLGIITNETNISQECKICYYTLFFNIDIRFELCVCNGCRDLLQISMNFNKIAVV